MTEMGKRQTSQILPEEVIKATKRESGKRAVGLFGRGCEGRIILDRPRAAAFAESNQATTISKDGESGHGPAFVVLR